MILQKIHLLGFKNYEQAEVVFSEKFNCFTGNNGMGKTNMLDAIYYLSFCKSYYNQIDSQNIKKDAPFFMIQGYYLTDSKEEINVYCGLKRGEKKQFKLNKKEYQRLSDHIGLIPLVMIAPEDVELILGGSEIRRKFVDGVIAQYNKSYLEQLIKYNKVLTQRNALLKAFHEKGNFDITALEIYDEQLSRSGDYIAVQRQQFFEKFNPIFESVYEKISGQREQVSIVLQSSSDGEKMEQVLTRNLEKDKVMLYTTAGIHKDDLGFEMNGNSIKKMASQGQQKSFLMALKLAQYCFIANTTGTKPLLLLDDVYDRLDELRLNNIMQYISQPDFGQVFITDTHPQRIIPAIESTKQEVCFFSIEQGVIKGFNNIETL